MADVFPRRNLPEGANPWGREVETRVRGMERSLTLLSQTVNNANRSDAGQLTILSQQIAELQARKALSVTPANISAVVGASAGSTSWVNRTFTFDPPEGGARNAILFGAGSLAWTGTDTGWGTISDGVSVAVEVRQEGTTRWSSPFDVASARMFSWQGDPEFSVTIPVLIPAAGSTFTIRLRAGKTASGGQSNAGCRLENMRFTLLYLERA